MYSGGYTLGQIRQSLLTRLAEASEEFALINAKSRHGFLQMLERYINSPDYAFAALTVRQDRTGGNHKGHPKK